MPCATTSIENGLDAVNLQNVSNLTVILAGEDKEAHTSDVEETHTEVDQNIDEKELDKKNDEHKEKI